MTAGELTVVGAALVDVRYSERLNRLVLALADTNRLLVVNPFTGDVTEHALPFTPVALALSPSGHVAAAADAGATVARLELATGQVTTSPTPANATAAFLAVDDRGLAIVAPVDDGTLLLVPHEGLPSAGPSVPGSAQLAFSHDGVKLWAEDDAVGLHRFSVDGSVITLDEIYPHIGPEIVPCEKVWVGEGDRLMAASCQLMFILDENYDFGVETYSDEDGETWVAWSFSVEAGRGAFVKGGNPSIVTMFDGSDLGSGGPVFLPVDENDAALEAEGIFFSASGTKLVAAGNLGAEVAVTWLETP